MAIEIVDLSIKHGDFPWLNYVNVYYRVRRNSHVANMKFARVPNQVKAHASPYPGRSLSHIGRIREPETLETLAAWSTGENAFFSRVFWQEAERHKRLEKQNYDPNPQVSYPQPSIAINYFLMGKSSINSHFNSRLVVYQRANHRSQLPSWWHRDTDETAHCVTRYASDHMGISINGGTPK